MKSSKLFLAVKKKTKELETAAHKASLAEKKAADERKRIKKNPPKFVPSEEFVKLVNRVFPSLLKDCQGYEWVALPQLQGCGEGATFYSSPEKWKGSISFWMKGRKNNGYLGNVFTLTKYFKDQVFVGVDEWEDSKYWWELRFPDISSKDKIVDCKDEKPLTDWLLEELSRYLKSDRITQVENTNGHT